MTTATPATRELLGDGTRVTIRAADGDDIAALVGIADGDHWPVLPLAPAGGGAAALPGVDGDAALVLLALDGAGACLGLASYDRSDGETAATFAVDVSGPARGRGVAAALVRRLAEAAARHGIRELHGWPPPAEARELAFAAPATDRLLATAGDRWRVAEYVVLPGTAPATLPPPRPAPEDAAAMAR